ncbi:MAG TPA: long-chain fatty acid--CoA ligase [Halobacteria archaeon]|nr:long-chain fatty acid--CoA ligase [Halobacteria archaeon]
MKIKYLKKPWLRLYDFMSLPETFEPYPVKAYAEYHLDEPAERWPDNLALVQFDYEMTYKELKDHVDRFATALADLGVKKGDVVATVLPTSIQYVISDFAITEIGAIHLPSSIIDSVDGLANKFKMTECQNVICCHTNVNEGDIISKIRKVAELTPIKNIIITKKEDYSLTEPDHDDKDILWFTDLIEKYPPNPPKVDIDPKRDIAIISYTGGATGIPKGVMLSHYGLVAHTVSFFGSILPEPIINLCDGLLRILMPLPQYHTYGHGMTVIGLRHGYGILLLTDPRDSKEFVRLAKRYHPTICFGAPVQYMKVLKEDDATDLGLIAISGSMPLSPMVHMQFEEKTGSIMMEAYGLAEFAPGTHVPSLISVLTPIFGSEEQTGEIFQLLNNFFKTTEIFQQVKNILNLISPEELGLLLNKIILFISRNTLTTLNGRKKEIMGTIGIPCVDVDVKITDVLTGEEIPIDVVVKEEMFGEMCLRAPWQMLGYWPDIGSGIDEAGFIRTGDVVNIDEWGRMFIIDKVKDMINVSGYKVYPREIDDLLYEYPGIDEVATIGYPDPARPGSDLIKVIIVPEEGYKDRIKDEEILDYLRKKLPPYAVPRQIDFRDSLPKTSTGKILKKQLKEEEIKKMSPYYTHYSYYVGKHQKKE